MNSNKEKEWDSRLKEIDTTLTLLEQSRYIFREYLKIIESNPKLQEENHFITWIYENYLYSASMAVRRLMDDQKRNSISSMIRFLMEVKGDPRILSRKRYASLLGNTDFSEDPFYINLCFDRLVGEGKDYLSSEEIQNKINRLKEKYAKLKDYIDNRIAHSSAKVLRKVPTVKDLDDCIDCLAELFEKYYSIFNAVSTELLPEIQYPWKDIFKTPWMSSSK